MSKPPLVCLKLGGSLLSDKRVRGSFKPAVATRLAREIKHALQEQKIRLLLAHGGGALSHFPAHEYATREGLAGGGGWRGFAETRRGVIEMNRRVLDAFARAGFFPTLVSPSAQVICSADRIQSWDLRIIETLLASGQVPLIHGDVVLDARKEFTILSTEQLFSRLAPLMKPARVILACDVEGVYLGRLPRSKSSRPIGIVDHRNITEIRRAMRSAGKHATDVTGGIASKVELLYRLSRRVPGMEARIISGLVPGNVASALAGDETGTLIRP